MNQIEFKDVDIRRFWSKVEIVDDKNSCWNWNAGCFSDGYGAFYLAGKTRKAQRISWILSHGQLGELCVLHKCDNPKCVRPDHLFLGTNVDNMRDKVSKNRTCCGEQHGGSKLSERQVTEIRKKYSNGEYTQVELGNLFKVSNVLISLIVNRKAWKHVA